MIERKTVSQCVSEDYCKGWNDAVDAMPKWISVEERLPEFVIEGCNYKITETVLAVDSTGFSYAGYFRVCNYDGSREFCGVDVDVLKCDTYSVTHWMPLPEPPEENE